MEDELARLRRALRDADRELDLARVFAESRDRALTGVTARERTRRRRRPLRGGAHRDRGGVVTIPLDVPEAGPASVRAPRRPFARRALVTSLALAAAVVAAVAFGLPGDESAVSPSATAGAPAASPVPTTPPQGAAQRIAAATSADGLCYVRTRARLGDDAPVTQVDRLAGSPATPTVDLARQPLLALREAGLAALRDLRAGRADVWGTVVSLGVEQTDGTQAERVRATTPGPPVRGGRVTRVEYLVDRVTWLPRTQEVRAVTDDGDELVLVSDLAWLGCEGHDVDTSGAGTGRSTVDEAPADGPAGVARDQDGHAGVARD
ncbi:hypothetical protein [Xylanimonas protaetiae]|uniref:Uncharacterized protein n=1 Tax=Xylanimonas protaetiae TaxID=2509457 RepID=A0A4P6F600_9MICO|nr:hypothetical protein [Xylanimonas protaetiae]QAY70825.1 hypothetical protein ET471_13000 [Xylanimonas protaetiae]